MKKTLKIGKNSYSFTLYDLFLFLTFVWLIVLATPYLQAQFHGLEKTADKTWNLCLDFVTFNVVIIVFLILRSLLNLFDSWVDKKKTELS